MTPEIAQATLQLLQRVQLSPSEIEAFVTVSNTLQGIIKSAEVVEEPKEKEEKAA